MTHKDDLLELLETNQRTLVTLELKKAKYGLAVPSHIVIEIEDTEAEIQKLQAELDALQGGDQDMVSLDRNSPPPRSLGRSLILWLLVGITLVIIVVSVVLLGNRGDDGGDVTPDPSEAVTITDVSGDSTPEGTLAPSPTPILDSLIITTPIQMELLRVPTREVQPQDVVAVDEFFIGKYEVTNKQYKAFMDAKGYEAPSHWERRRMPPGKEDHPVVNVSWDRADDFTKWLSDETGLDFYLPTVEEWERACQGDELYLYPWGDDPPQTDEATANFDWDTNGTAPVGSYPGDASPYGVLDMAGNVREWTASENERGYRMVRGSYYSNSQPHLLSCTHRQASDPNRGYDHVGFRVVVSPQRP